jgi:murein DD-endopeptidase MepM/ murein hydrolase activator NlpD
MPSVVQAHGTWSHRFKARASREWLLQSFPWMRFVSRLALLTAAAALIWYFRVDLLRYVPSSVVATLPHERYTAAIRTAGLADTELGSTWLRTAEAVLNDARPVDSRFSAGGAFDETNSRAAAWRFAARRGQRLVITADFTAGELFLDVIDSAGHHAAAGTTSRASTLVHEVNADGHFILRAQPELLRTGPFRITQVTEASLDFPLRGVSPHAVHGPFGAPRDGGTRRHEGIDIFAPRGTPVVAAADGWITGSTTNRLGGNVVWLWAPSRRVALYYAHLDRHAVSRGERVHAGDVLGYVGTTGNARGTSPHLHFGIYATGEGAVDPAPFVVDPPGATRPPGGNTRKVASSRNGVGQPGDDAISDAPR